MYIKIANAGQNGQIAKYDCLMNNVSDKQTNNQMPGRNVKSGQDLNQERLDKKPIL